jgi:hypothetical protein
MSHHGVSIEEIARLVGHASTRTTELAVAAIAAASCARHGTRIGVGVT